MGSCTTKVPVNNHNQQIKEEILILLGSARSQSVNKSLITYLQQSHYFTDRKIKVHIPQLTDIPFFNYDLFKNNG
jgi:NAD(P)H-dependent FMN reductase